MLFLHQALTWGFLLTLVPLLIHLINMMRHQRVQWAAMEFLLQSYRKHRQWVWLKQFLLLMARMLAVALIVALLAQLITRDRWLQFFGGQTTHHYVLLDDSYSMSERTSGASAFDVARQAITRLVAGAENADSPQRFTLVRYSQAAKSSAAGDSSSLSSAVDFNAAIAANGLELKLQEKFRTVEPTELSLGPDPALALVNQLIGDSPDEVPLVHLFSDFRQPDWDAAAETKEQLRRLREHKAEIHLLQCARPAEPNLGIIEISPANDTRAAAVPLFVNIKVKNHGLRPVSRVQVKVRSIEYPAEDVQAAAIEQLQGTSEDVVTLMIEELGPGESVVRRAQLYFPKPGKHVVEASIPDDSVAADNRRWCVIDFPVGERVLIVDGAIDQQHAYYLQAAMQPLQRSVTGLRPEVKPAAFLRDISPEALRTYSAVYLLDVPRLDDRAVENLEGYVTSGGGLAIFLGPGAQADYYNRSLFKEGQGLMPYPIGFEYELAAAIDDGSPDVELTNHPIFSFFTAQTNPLVSGITVERYRRPKEGWKESLGDGEQTTAVIARLRDRQPLMLERSFGNGRVVCLTTTLAPDWNDWAKNPSFVVLLLKLQGYLASPERMDDPRLVGTPVEVNLDPEQFQNEMTFVIPGPQRVERTTIVQNLVADTSSQRVRGTIGDPRTGKEVGATDRSGVYEAWPVTTLGEVALQRWALNVAPTEGNVATIDGQELVRQLEPVAVQFHRAENYQQDISQMAGVDLSPWLLAALIALLIGEQALAYFASYHLVQGGAK